MARSAPHATCALVLTALFVVTALSGCLTGGDAEVYGTFYPMTFLAQEIGGDVVEVDQIIPEGTEPHEWDPGIRDVSRLGSARLVVAQSPEFETWLTPLVDNLGPDAPTVLYTTEALGLHEEDHGGDHDEEHEGEHDEEHEGEHDEEHEGEHDEEHEDGDADGHDGDHENEHDDHEDEHDEHDHGDDPHSWLDPVLMAGKAVAVRDALIEQFPEHNATFRQNTEDLVSRLHDLDAAYQDRLAECGTRHIVVQHDAFGFLAQRYEFEVHSVVGLSPQAEPDPRSVARAVETAVEYGLGVVFTETRASPTVMNAVAEDASSKGTQVEVRVLSPLERRSAQEIDEGLDYLDIMYNNLDELQAAMRCTSE